MFNNWPMKVKQIQTNDEYFVYREVSKMFLVEPVNFKFGIRTIQFVSTVHFLLTKRSLESVSFRPHRIPVRGNRILIYRVQFVETLVLVLKTPVFLLFQFIDPVLGAHDSYHAG